MRIILSASFLGTGWGNVSKIEEEYNENMPEQEPNLPKNTENLLDTNLQSLHPNDLYNFAKELIAANDVEGMRKIYDFADKRRDKVYSESIDYWACVEIMDEVSKALGTQE